MVEARVRETRFLLLAMGGFSAAVAAGAATDLYSACAPLAVAAAVTALRATYELGLGSFDRSPSPAEIAEAATRTASLSRTDRKDSHRYAAADPTEPSPADSAPDDLRQSVQGAETAPAGETHSPSRRKRAWTWTKRNGFKLISAASSLGGLAGLAIEYAPT